jgi:hypothetical protein
MLKAVTFYEPRQSYVTDALMLEAVPAVATFHESDLFPRLHWKSLDEGLSIQNNFSFMLGTNQLDVSMSFDAFRMYTSTYGEWLPEEHLL